MAVVAPAAVVLLAAVAQAGTLLVLGWNSDYWYDDLLHLAEVRAGLGLSYHDLMLPVFGHMIPGFRLVFWLLQHGFPGQYRVALVLEALCAGGSTLVLGRILRLISRRPMASAVIAALVAFSAAQVGTWTWFSQALVAMPSTLLSLLAIERFLTWRQDRRPDLLVGCLVSWVLGLAFYEKAALVPVWLFLLVAFVLPERWTPRAAVREVVDTWRAWIGFVLLGVVWLVAYHSGAYGSTVPSPSAGQFAGFTRIAWFKNFWVSAVGGATLVGVPQGGTLVRLAGQALFVALVVVTVSFRRQAWRAWVFFVLAFLLHVGLVGYGRAGWGADLGTSSFYVFETTWLLAIAVAAALRHAPGVVPALRPARARAVSVGLASLLLVVAAVRGAADARTTFRPYAGRAVHHWTTTIASSAAAVRKTTKAFSVFDDRAPWYFVQTDYPRFDRLSAVLGTGYVHLVYDDLRLPQYLVDPTGVLRPAQLQVQGAWLPAAGAAHECWQGPRRLALKHHAKADSLFLHLRTDQPTPVQVRLWLQNGKGPPQLATDTDGLVDLPAGPSDRLLPLLPTAATAVYVNAPDDTQVCVATLEVGTPVAR